MVARALTQRHARVRLPEGRLERIDENHLRFQLNALPPWPPFFRWQLVVTGRHSPTRQVVRSVPLDHTEITIPVDWPRGQYQVEASWRLEDLFGFTRWVPPSRWTLTLTIPPRAGHQLPPRPPATRPGPWRPRRVGQRAGDPFDVRPYVPGDDLRRLHWPLLAHSGTAFVRTAEPSPPPTGHEFILLDTEAPTEEVLDDRLGRLMGWLDQLDQQGTGWTVVVPAVGLVFRSLPGEALAGLSPRPLHADVLDPSWPEMVTVVTGPSSPPVAELTRRFAASRRRLRAVEVPLPAVDAPPPRPWWSRQP